MSNMFENKGALGKTIVVAAADSLNQGQANYVCDGTIPDDAVIQAALDALPATGGEVLLLDGTYNCTATIDLDSNQTLRGCGRNTILTTSTAGLVFLSAVGGAGTEKKGIVIADLQIYGAAAALGAEGIHFEYTDYSIVYNVYTYRFNAQGNKSGIYLTSCDFNVIIGNAALYCYRGVYLISSTGNTITGNNGHHDHRDIELDGSSYNTIAGNTYETNIISSIWLVNNSNSNTITGNTCRYGNYDGIQIHTSSKNTVTGNTVQGFAYEGITLPTASHYNTISGNTCLGNTFNGILLDKSNNNTISGNTCAGNGRAGISLVTSHNNAVVGNLCTENSQTTTNTYQDIDIALSNYNDVQDNICRAGALANKPQYAIYISGISNVVIDNDLYNDGFGTAPFNDAGTLTRLNTYKVPFSDGSDRQDSGFLIDAAAEMARAWLRLPDKVVQVVRAKVYARSVVLEADKMRAEFVVYGAADNEAYNTHNGSVADHPSTSANFAANDVIYWTLTAAGLRAMLGGDSIEVKVLHEVAGGADCATNAYFRTVEIEYV